MRDMNYEILNSFHQDLIGIMTAQNNAQAQTTTETGQVQNTAETGQAQNTPEVKFEKV